MNFKEYLENYIMDFRIAKKARSYFNDKQIQKIITRYNSTRERSSEIKTLTEFTPGTGLRNNQQLEYDFRKQKVTLLKVLNPEDKGADWKFKKITDVIYRDKITGKKK